MSASVPLTSFFNDVKICVTSYFMYRMSHEGKYCTKCLNKRLKHGRQNITLYWINGIIRNNKCIFTKLNAVFNTQNGCMNKKIKYCTKCLNQYSFICSKFYKLYKYKINISHNKTTGLQNSLNNLKIRKMKIKEANLFNTVGCCI
jgi:hypothetical protein